MGPPKHSPNIDAMSLLVIVLLVTLVTGVAIHPPEYDYLATNFSSFLSNASSPSNTSSNGMGTISARRPDDMSWIKKWAAVGDSYTAGIGAGQLYGDTDGDYQCSRYDKSYPAILKRTLGPSATNFKYAACSGARTGGILDQVKGLEKDMDLVVMTAGGNDLCLSAIIRSCIMMPYFNSKGCQDAIHNAESNLEKILPGNLREILNALNDKMAHDGVVIFAGYAQFFYAVQDDDDCEKKQDFTFPRTGGVGYAPLTVESRKRFNNLVVKTNQLIKNVVRESRDKHLYKYHIRYADWDVWPRNKEIAGQMCWPGSTGDVPDPKQRRLQFFKPATSLPDHQDLRKRDNSTEVISAHELAPVDPVSEKKWCESLYTSVLYRTVNPFTEVLSRLNARDAIQPPNCPGGGGSGIGLPDRWGKFYHPNELDHQTMASFVMNEIISARGEVLRTNNPVCEKKDSFMCFHWIDSDKPHWNNPSLLDATYQKYCDEVKPGENPNWVDQRVFNEFTNEAHRYTIRTENGAFLFSKTQCLDAFKHIIYSCDTDKKVNPYGWKHGGTYKRGSYTYELQHWTTHKRAWPLDRPIAKCEGHYRGIYSKYKLRGSGWLDDNGEKLRHAANRCVGGGVTDWEFKWLPEPDKDNMEWEATFHTPIWVRLRCFKNNKVQKSVGGPDGGCTGSD